MTLPERITFSVQSCLRKSMSGRVILTAQKPGCFIAVSVTPRGPGGGKVNFLPPGNRSLRHLSLTESLDYRQQPFTW